MFKESAPMATSPDHVWVFVTSYTGAVAVSRLAHKPGSSVFIGLPGEAFDLSALLPTYVTGELLDGFRWATTADVDAYAHLF